MGYFDHFTSNEQETNSAANEVSDGGIAIQPPKLFGEGGFAANFGSSIWGESAKTSENPDFDNDNFSKAKSFEQLIQMVEVAEDRLAAAGIAEDPETVVRTLRGIFYGTEWSMDYEGSGNEGSWIRNSGFDYYTKHRRPDDPRDALGMNLFLALRESAEVKDPSGKHTDFGHIVIGVETQDWLGQLPTGTGGTGNEVVTWLGDLGGGAGMLAMRRGGIVPGGRASDAAYRIFSSASDYGASINVEGDIAGTVGVVLEEGKTFSQVLREYLVEENDRYDRRAELFLNKIGGETAENKLTNRSDLISQLTDQFISFGQFYDLTRIKDKSHYKVTPTTLRNAGKHMEGSAHEVATIFVAMLEKGMLHPEKNIRADSSMDPGVTPPASEATSQFEYAALALEAIEEGKKEWEKGKKEAGKYF